MVRKLCIIFNTLLACFICAVILTGGWIYLDLKESDKQVVTQGPSAYVYHNARYEYARKYHAVLVTQWHKEKREWGFYRKNKWCSLYRSIPKKAWDRYYAGLQSKEKRG